MASYLIETSSSTMFTPLRVKKLIESFICSRTFCETFKLFLLVVLIFWSISMVIMGYVYRDECPYENHRLSNYLALFGASTLVFLLSNIIVAFHIYMSKMEISNMKDMEDCWSCFVYDFLLIILRAIFSPCMVISLAFEIISLFHGSSLVYSAPYVESKNNDTFALTFTNTSSKAYCNETFFNFSFWSFSSVYISLGLLILVKLVSKWCNAFENSVKVVVFKFFSRFVFILVLLVNVFVLFKGTKGY